MCQEALGEDILQQRRKRKRKVWGGEILCESKLPQVKRLCANDGRRDSDRISSSLEGEYTRMRPTFDTCQPFPARRPKAPAGISRRCQHSAEQQNSSSSSRNKRGVESSPGTPQSVEKSGSLHVEGYRVGHCERHAKEGPVWYRLLGVRE